MARKQQKQLTKEIHEAIEAIRDLQKAAPNNNQKLTESLKISENWLMEQLFEEVGRNVKKSKGGT